jgi:hypothetical protein
LLLDVSIPTPIFVLSIPWYPCVCVCALVQEFFAKVDSEELHLPPNDESHNTMRPLLEDMGHDGTAFTMEGQAGLENCE